MDRCKHSVFLATPAEVKTRKSLNCSLCTPEIDSSFLRPQEEINFVMPRYASALDEDRVYANKHDPARCPECNSQIHSVEPDKRWKCCECGHVWKGRANV